MPQAEKGCRKKGSPVFAMRPPAVLFCPPDKRLLSRSTHPRGADGTLRQRRFNSERNAPFVIADLLRQMAQHNARNRSLDPRNH
jgi:hypothetical protein